MKKKDKYRVEFNKLIKLINSRRFRTTLKPYGPAILIIGWSETRGIGNKKDKK